jgi:hypothetical protein
MKVVALGFVLAALSGSATPVRVTIVGKPTTAVAGKAWKVRLAVRPASFRGIVSASSRPVRTVLA